jgi:hypothetical protein
VTVGRAGFSVGTAIVVAATLAVAGCGNAPSTPPPGGPLADALAAVGGGGAHGSLGIGWADPRLVAKAGAGARLISEALGPNARSVIEEASRLHRRFGLDPLTAERLVSVGGSYAFGLRLDGVDGRQLGRRLVDAGGRAHRLGQLELLDIGDYAVVPEPLLRSGVLGLGARDAFSHNLTVLAISETARDALLGRGDRLLDEPTYRAAADCLGDVIAARLIPDNLLLSTDLGIDLVALGVSRPEREVLCALGGTAERASEVASALKSSLAPNAREPVTGEPIRDSVAAVRVVRDRFAGVEEVRARLTLATGQSPGFLFGAVSRGSLVGLINGS